ncbi:hypothetical protein X874_11810 [Mannheimia varigena USDA-ARS-USMARC-1312]|nr:hypothetical protein X874_11810 [Mannheimia varigena USDA-ARS-USMARC-1312]
MKGKRSNFSNFLQNSLESRPLVKPIKQNSNSTRSRRVPFYSLMGFQHPSGDGRYPAFIFK